MREAQERLTWSLQWYLSDGRREHRTVVVQQERLGCWCVADAATGERLMCGLGSADSAHTWAMAHGCPPVRSDEETLAILARMG